MHPFHMLGKIYASPTVYLYVLFKIFWIHWNFEVTKSRVETRLNGGNSSSFLLFSSEGNLEIWSENNPVPNRIAPRQFFVLAIRKRSNGHPNRSRHKSVEMTRSLFLSSNKLVAYRKGIRYGLILVITQGRFENVFSKTGQGLRSLLNVSW